MIRTFFLVFIILINAKGHSSELFVRSNDTTKIGFLLSDLKIERWKSDRDYFILTARDQGYEVMVADAENNQEKQIEQANYMIKAGIKILVIIAVDSYKAAKIVENAHKEGVRVLAYDRLIMNCDLDAYIAYDNEGIGNLMAEYIKVRKHQGLFFYLGGPKSDRNTYYIRKGLMSSLEPFIKNKSIVIVCDTFTGRWDEQEAGDIIEKYLNSGAKVPDVIFAGNDQLARGVIKVLENKGLRGKVMITGQDGELEACRYIIEGKQTMTIYKPIRTLADKAVLLCSWLLGDISFDFFGHINNGKVNVNYFKLLPIPVDSSNMRMSIIFDKFHTVKEIYR